MAAWSRVVGTAVAAVDRAFVVAMQMRGARAKGRVKQLPHEERLTALASIAGAYGEVGAPEGLFGTPPSIDPTLRLVRRGAPPRTETWDASWPSAFVPYLTDLAERYMARVENRTAHARLVLAKGAGARARRPAVIAVHGYMCGQFAFEEAVWPIAWLSERGLDVALPVLPFHALRAGARRGAPTFPSADPRVTNEGFRQAVADITSLARFLRDRGAPHVGVMGMSLGGYTSALVATVSDAVDFVMPIIPLVSIADFARDRGELGTGERAESQRAALERANRVVSPLARPLLLPRTRALVVAAEHDRITPTLHAHRLATHFGCDMVTIPGGHLVQLGRSRAFRALASMLAREGIIAAAEIC
jgi:pimeloyl-ACP methyl ester carboxylesterase